MGTISTIEELRKRRGQKLWEAYNQARLRHLRREMAELQEKLERERKEEERARQAEQEYERTRKPFYSETHIW